MNVDEFIERNEKIIKKFCRRLCGNREQAEELAQETFIRALSHYALLTTLSDPQRRAWLFTTARNAFVDICRLRAREKNLDSSNQTEEIFEEVNLGEFERIISKLPELYQEVLILKFVLDLNSREIADRLKVPSSTIRRRLQMAIKKIKDRGELT